MYFLALSLLVGCSPTDTTLTNGPQDQEVVTGTGRMTLDVEEIVISDIQLGFSESAAFTITSAGDTNLQVYEIKITANDTAQTFYFPEVEDLELAPEQTATYSVVADLETAEAVEGVLRLRTSDPDNATVNLPLKAYPEGYVPPEDTGGDSGGTDSGE